MLHLVRYISSGLGISFSALLVVISMSVFYSRESGAKEIDFKLWNSTEIRGKHIEQFTKWMDVLRKIEKEKPRLNKECPLNAFAYYDLCHWKKFVLEQVNKKPIEQLRAVNLNANQRRYISDPINWHVPDYWESTGEFVDKQGDCEDFAIVKYMALRLLGFKPDNLRIVIVVDQNLASEHAVLVVYVDGQTLLLDNQTSRVAHTNRVDHYLAVYSINEENWWRHLTW